MNGKIITALVAAGLIAAVCAAVLCMDTGRTPSVTIDEDDEGNTSYIDNVDAIAYTDYNVIRQIVQKLDTFGGQIIDTENRSSTITTEYKVELCGDLIVAYTSDYSWIKMYDVHDIRSIHIS